MNIELISSHEEIAASNQVTFEIQGLEPHPQGGTYVVRWLIEPSGSLTPTGETVAIDGDHIYSVFSAEEQAGPARATFDVQTENPVTVAVDVRYRKGQFPLSQARAAHRAAPTKTEASHNLGVIGSASLGPGNGHRHGRSDGERPIGISAPAPSPVAVSMQRAAITPTATQALWTLIRQSTNALSFQNYQAFMEQVLCGGGSARGAPFPPANGLSLSSAHVGRQLPWRLPFPGVEPYRQLKAATEVFVMLNCGVPFDQFMAADHSPPFLSPTQQWSGDPAGFRGRDAG